MVTFGIVNLTILMKLFLSKGGGGWRKTFKFSSDPVFPFRDSKPDFTLEFL
jgi:hypothetical protein